MYEKCNMDDVKAMMEKLSTGLDNTALKQVLWSMVTSPQSFVLLRR